MYWIPVKDDLFFLDWNPILLLATDYQLRSFKSCYTFFLEKKLQKAFKKPSSQSNRVFIEFLSGQKSAFWTDTAIAC